MSGFSKSIGGSHGSGAINKQSIGISQSSGSPVDGGYYTNTQKPYGTNVSPVANEGGSGVTGISPKNPPAPKARKAGNPPPPSKTSR